MFTSFKELEAYVLGCGMKKRIALANAHDEPALSAVVNARRKGVVEGTLVGKKDEIIAMLHEMGESENDYEIVDFDGEELDAAKLTVQLRPRHPEQRDGTDPRQRQAPGEPVRYF